MQSLNKLGDTEQQGRETPQQDTSASEPVSDKNSVNSCIHTHTNVHALRMLMSLPMHVSIATSVIYPPYNHAPG